MVSGAGASVVCRSSALVVATALVGWWGTAFLVLVAILIAIRLASSNSVRRVLAIFVLGLTVFAHPIVGINVGWRRNEVAGSDKSHTGIVVLPWAALTEPYEGELRRPAEAAFVACDLDSLRGGHICSP